MRSLFVCTTLEDHSFLLFLLAEVRSLASVEVAFYEDGLDSICARLREFPYDAVYLRDPYTSVSLSPQEATRLFDGIGRALPPAAYVVDGARSAEGALFEDKWRQYGLYKRFMPHTVLYDPEHPPIGPAIYKERISSRARGIFFRTEDLSPPFDRFIAQELHGVREEYRVYGLFGEVCPVASRKSPKTAESRVRVFDTVEVSGALREFASEILAVAPLDLCGLDIIETADGRQLLLEVNRSPQFSAFRDFAYINLAREFVLALSRRLG